MFTLVTPYFGTAPPAVLAGLQLLCCLAAWGLLEPVGQHQHYVQWCKQPTKVHVCYQKAPHMFAALSNVTVAARTGSRVSG
jgi:hypothetical protein